MLIRLALETDEDACVEMARAHHVENLPERAFSEILTRATFQRYLATSQPTIFVAVQNDVVVGFLSALYSGFASTDGLFVTEEIIYIKPAKRGTRAATLLVKEFIEWAEKTMAALESFITVAVDDSLERNIKFFQRHGYEPTGIRMVKKRG